MLRSCVGCAAARHAVLVRFACEKLEAWLDLLPFFPAKREMKERRERAGLSFVSSFPARCGSFPTRRVFPFRGTRFLAPFLFFVRLAPFLFFVPSNLCSFAVLFYMFTAVSAPTARVSSASTAWTFAVSASASTRRTLASRSTDKRSAVRTEKKKAGSGSQMPFLSSPSPRVPVLGLT